MRLPPRSGIASTTAVAARPRMTSTTISSTKVKPFRRFRGCGVCMPAFHSVRPGLSTREIGLPGLHARDASARTSRKSCFAVRKDDRKGAAHETSACPPRRRRSRPLDPLPDGIVWEAFLTDGEATVYGDSPALDAIVEAPAETPCCAPADSRARA